MVALPLAYFASAFFAITAYGANSPIWVSNAFVVTALLRSPRATWPVLLALTVVAGIAANAGAGTPISGLGLGLSLCNVVEIFLVAASAHANDAVFLGQSIRRQARFLLACLLAPAISAAGGTGLLALLRGEPFLSGWTMWYLSDVSGLLIVVPLLLCWTAPTLRKDRFGQQAGQTVLLAALAALVGYLACRVEILGLYLVFPFLLLATFKGRLLGATTAAAALSGVAIWSTVAGQGPIAAKAGTDMVLKAQLLQLFIASVLLSSLPVAAFLEQREKLMGQLRATTRSAQAAARAKEEFLAVMSHEIRTPMTGVLGMADLLLNADLPAKERDYVVGIQRSGRHLLALINDILDFSKGEAKKLNLETIDFDLAEMLEQVRALLAPQAAERGLDLRIEHDPGIPGMLRGDPTRLKQVLVNLVGNGVKFTRRGSVTVTVRRRPTYDGRELVRFEVRDTGIGIAEEKQGVLFNAFSQIDASTTRHYGGSGLGLAISRKLVEAMGGAIGLESAPGAGSLFWFEVPLERGQEVAFEEHRPVLVACPPRLVLLAEDVELNRVLIADMLRSHGHQVVTAEHGEEAVAAAARELFDLVLMDVQMPVMDGTEATRRIRKLPLPAGAVPILALSANILPEEQDRYLAAGMNGALTKPIDWAQLFAALAKYGPAEGRGETGAKAPHGTVLAAPQPAGTVPALVPEPPLDAVIFDRLRHVQGGSEPLSARLAEIFLRDTARRLEALREAVQQGDAAAIVRMAHAIKGSAANLGAHSMVRICLSIEANATTDQIAVALARVDALQGEFQRAREALAVKLAAV